MTDPGLSRKTIVIAGQEPLCVPLTRLLAKAGIGSFVFLSLSEKPELTDHLIEAVREAGTGASIRFMRLSRLDSQDSLFPEETDLAADCLEEPRLHIQLEEACRRQGIPLVLAYEDQDLQAAAVADPYAGSLGLLFDGEEPPDLLSPEGIGDEDEDYNAASDAADKVVLALKHEISFSAPSLFLFKKKDRRLARIPMPSFIPFYPRLVLVGGDRRKLGKTTLCIQLAKKLTERGSAVRVLKIDNEGGSGEARLLEEQRDEKKASIQALFEAGADRVFRMSGSPASLFELLPFALGEIYETMDDKSILLCESNTARRFLQPGLFVQLEGAGGSIKPSAVLTRRLADRILPSPFSEGDVDALTALIERMIDDKRWRNSKNDI